MVTKPTIIKQKPTISKFQYRIRPDKRYYQAVNLYHRTLDQSTTLRNSGISKNCRYYANDNCKFGDKCLFTHSKFTQIMDIHA